MRNRLRPDRVTLASGAAVAALGALVLFDSAGVLDVSLWVMAAILAAFGVALLWGGRSRPIAPPAPAPRAFPAPAAPPPAARRSRFADLYNGVFGVSPRRRRGAALPLLQQRVEWRPRHGADHRGRARGHRTDRCAVPVAARAEPRRRARRADPLSGARRGRRPPPRLGAPDADPGAEARRRSARGRGAREAPGARAARLAGRGSAAREVDGLRLRASLPPPRRSRTTTASRSRPSPSAIARSTPAPRRCSAPPARRSRTRPSTRPSRARSASTRRSKHGRDRGVRPRPRPGLRPRRCPGRPSRCPRVDHRPDGA